MEKTRQDYFERDKQLHENSRTPILVIYGDMEFTETTVKIKTIYEAGHLPIKFLNTIAPLSETTFVCPELESRTIEFHLVHLEKPEMIHKKRYKEVQDSFLKDFSNNKGNSVLEAKANSIKTMGF